MTKTCQPEESYYCRSYFLIRFLEDFRIKFGYSEKTTKFKKNFKFKFDANSVKSNFKWKIFSNFVAFSEYLNFIFKDESDDE